MKAGFGSCWTESTTRSVEMGIEFPNSCLLYPVRFRVKISLKVGDFMDSILLTSENPADFTAVSNVFIDNYMPHAHGDYVKVYLYLLRCIGDACPDISVSDLADRFENTEKDIFRAIQYWERKELLKTERSSNGDITGISLLRPVVQQHVSEGDKGQKESLLEKSQGDILQPQVSSVAEVSSQTLIPRPVYTAEQIACMKEDPQVTMLLSQIEHALQRLLKPNDIQLILYLYESLNFSPELIFYLYRYCISMNKTHLKYIERVAVNWNRDGIRTVEQAEMTAKQYKKEYYTIARSLGFNRSLADPECAYVEKWLYQWKFSLEVVLEACRRTVLQTQNPSFPYIDKILESWHKSGVCSLGDIKKADVAFNKSASGKLAGASGHLQAGYKPGNNRFTSFEQHNYSRDEMNVMEKAMLHNSEKKIRKENSYESYK